MEENQKQTQEDFDSMVFQNPSIKISKNTKGYNFEFKILSNDVEEMDRVHNAIVAKIKSWENPKEEDGQRKE